MNAWKTQLTQSTTLHIQEKNECWHFFRSRFKTILDADIRMQATGWRLYYSKKGVKRNKCKKVLLYTMYIYVYLTMISF